MNAGGHALFASFLVLVPIGALFVVGFQFWPVVVGIAVLAAFIKLTVSFGFKNALMITGGVIGVAYGGYQLWSFSNTQKGNLHTAYIAETFKGLPAFDLSTWSSDAKPEQFIRIAQRNMAMTGRVDSQPLNAVSNPPLYSGEPSGILDEQTLRSLLALCERRPDVRGPDWIRSSLGGSGNGYDCGYFGAYEADDATLPEPDDVDPAAFALMTQVALDAFRGSNCPEKEKCQYRADIKYGVELKSTWREMHEQRELSLSSFLHWDYGLPALRESLTASEGTAKGAQAYISLLGCAVHRSNAGSFSANIETCKTKDRRPFEKEFDSSWDDDYVGRRVKEYEKTHLVEAANRCLQYGEAGFCPQYLGAPQDK